MHTGQIVKQKRLKMGLSQVQLADRSGVLQTTISAIERGVDPTGKTLKKLAIALNITVDDLLQEEVTK